MLEKITKQAVSANNVKSTPGQRLTGTVSENKHVFDKFPELISAALNSVIDALQSVADGDSGADCISITPIEGMSGTTVQSVLSTLKLMLDDVYTKSSIDNMLVEKADKTTVNMSLKEISLDSNTGIWTFTRQNGTSFTIDTLLEKIIVNFDYDKATQSIIFTASDGTLQPVSLSDFITETEFVDSDTIEVAVNNGVVSAHIKEGGISDDLLSSALKAALIGYRDDAQTAARNATASAENAGQYAVKAQESADAAAQKAKEAADTVSLTEGKAQEAESAATMAKSYAVGGTNSRAGEDTDNSKFYKEAAEQAKKAAEQAKEEAKEIVGGDYVTNKVFASHVTDTSLHVTQQDRERLGNLPQNTNFELECRVTKEEGKTLTSNDFTDAYKNQLDSLADIDTKLESLVKKVVMVSAVIAASEWNGNQYSFEALYPAEKYRLEIEYANTCTEEQVTAYSAAMLAGSITENVLTAIGEVPTIDIPVYLSVTDIAEQDADGNLLKIGNTDTGYYVEIDGKDRNLENVVSSETELTNDNYNLDIL